MFKITFLLLMFNVKLNIGNPLNDIGIPVHLNDDNAGNEQEQEADEIHLEDFFWTGSGDGPPDYIQKVHTGISKGKNIIVKTETVVATIYTDGKNDLDEQPPSGPCLDCFKDNLPINITTTDRRYWLLTVVSGFLKPRDNIFLEDKLAKLYRLAFTRQQSKHLGITNGKSNISIRNKRQTENYTETETNLENNLQIIENVTNGNDTTKLYIVDSILESQNKSKDEYRIDVKLPRNFESDEYIDEQSMYNDQQVRIFIHNVTLLTEDEIQKWGDANGYEDDRTDKRDSRPLANQTEIIYSVFVNNKPVMATTAAEDMKLLTENEVAAVIQKTVYMKAEPYLREPQATPLVPASTMSSVEPSFLAYIQNNSFLIAISSIAFLLVLFLLLALLLMTRSKRQRSAEVKRLSARHGLLSDNQASQGFETGRTDGLSTISKQRNLEDGVENYGYVNDQLTNNRPHISFPLPPVESRPGSGSTTSTSDSSVYCPVNRPNNDLQLMLDEKAAKLFDKKRKHSSRIGVIQYPTDQKAEPIYTSVIGGAVGGGARKRDKQSKYKNRRKYLSENRVGSIDEADAQSSAETSMSTDDNISDTFKPNYENYEHHETFNLQNNYHRNKILQNRVFTDKLYDSVHEEVMTPTEAINREIIRALQPTEKSSETGSIGSFLSMASVKSFPKNQLPEPLHRVLEPVSVTYYDHYDNTGPKSKIKQTAAASSVIESKHNDTHHCNTITLASQSDNPDPGVLGPIVWEIHKNKLTRNESSDSPAHDPVITRNRFEGLLEGAIQMYDDSSPIPQSIEQKHFRKLGYSNKSNGRGKSAIVSSATKETQKFSSDNRPLTAGPDKTFTNNQSSQPSSPHVSAWGSGAVSPPLVRPLSAGPFHRPQPPNVDVTRVLASQNADKAQLSAAPLIEAIQNELQKFKRGKSQ